MSIACLPIIVEPMPEVTFIADVMLGKLSKWLRILGFDTEYSPASGTDELVKRAAQENRQILTRNTRLNKRTDLKSRICFIKANYPMEQVREVIDHYKLKGVASAALTRCVICNRKLEAIASMMIVFKVPDYVLNTKKNFFTCPCCQRIYWRGTHYHSMQELLRKKVFDI